MLVIVLKILSSVASLAMLSAKADTGGVLRKTMLLKNAKFTGKHLYRSLKYKIENKFGNVRKW